MAVTPYLLQAGFEGNALDLDLAETDTASAASIYHYTDLVKTHNIVPWRGAYCFLIDQSVALTTEAFLVSSNCNVTAQYYWSMGFAFYAKSTTMATTNCTSLVKLLASTTVEGCLSLYYTTAGGLQLGLTETVPGTVPTAVLPLTENVWHWIELYGVNDPGSNDGTMYLVLDGNATTNIGSLNQGAFDSMQIGLDDQDAGHTAGIYVFDDLIFTGIHTAAVRTGYRSRHTMNPHVSCVSTTAYADCIFVGPGTLAGAAILTSTSGDYMRFYDTDRGYITGDYGDNLVAEISYNGPSSIEGPIVFERGCLCVIGGTSARGQVFISTGSTDVSGEPYAKCYLSDALLKDYVYRRSELSGSR